MPYKHGLLVYRLAIKPNELTLTDISTKPNEPSAKSIMEGIKLLTDHLAEELKTEDEFQSIKNVSQYIYDNFKYNADGYLTMTVANMHNSEMACQGITLLSKLILGKMGIETEIRLGHSHYWLIAKTSDGREITYDPTTDIILNKANLTLGLSTDQHLYKSYLTNMYDSTYETSKYKSVANYFLN